MFMLIGILTICSAWLWFCIILAFVLCTVWLVVFRKSMSIFEIEIASIRKSMSIFEIEIASIFYLFAIWFCIYTWLCTVWLVVFRIIVRTDGQSCQALIRACA